MSGVKASMNPKTLVDSVSNLVMGAAGARQPKQYRICFVGNSHLAAVKLGWDILASQYPDVQSVFFGASRRKMDGVAVEAGALIPTSEVIAADIAKVSGGATSVRLSDFDLICLVGLQFGFLNLLGLIQRFRTYPMAALGNRSRLLSRASMKQAYRDRLEASFAVKLARKIRSQSAVDLLLVQSPIPSFDLVSTDPWVNLPFDQVGSTITETFGIYQEIVEAISVSEGICILPQPESTIGPSGLSKEEFTRGSSRLESEGQHRDDDFMHMNQRYGVVMLEPIMEVTGVEKKIA